MLGKDVQDLGNPEANGPMPPGGLRSSRIQGLHMEVVVPVEDIEGGKPEVSRDPVSPVVVILRDIGVSLVLKLLPLHVQILEVKEVFFSRR